MTSYLGLQIEKEDLLAALENEKQQVIDDNKNLEKDIQKKIQTEAKLLYEKKCRRYFEQTKGIVNPGWFNRLRNRVVTSLFYTKIVLKTRTSQG